jgi:NAD(P)-dependent dehydrogenase (short-subunit alcohol dehydrogenase family)
MGSLDGKVAVVTGAASGIGAATARLLSGQGASVVAVDVDEDGVRGVAGELPGPSVAVPANVSEEDDVPRYVDTAVAEFGRIDLHHLNAGIVGSFIRRWQRHDQTWRNRAGAWDTSAVDERDGFSGQEVLNR